MKDFNEFDKIIRDKIGGINEMPPPHLWTNISKGIATPAVQATGFKAFLSGIGTTKIVAIAASIAIILGFVWFINNTENNNNITKNTIIDSVNNTTTIENQKRIGTNNKEQLIINKKNSENKIVKSKINNQQLKTELSSISSTDIDNSTNNIKKPKTVLVKPNNTSKPTIAKQTSFEKGNSLNPNSKKHKSNKATKAVIVSKSVNTNIEIKAPAVDQNPKLIAEDSSTDNNIIAINNNTEEQTTENNNVIINNTTKDSVATTDNNITSELIAKETEPEDLKTDNSIKAIDSTAIVNNNDNNTSKRKFNFSDRNYDKYSLGIHYGAEVINVGDINISSNNFDFSFNYQNNRFIVQTGFGFQISKDQNQYNQEYMKSEYLDTQIRFDSIDFVPDGSGGMIPTPVKPYYVDVYDSVNHSYSDKIYETYYSIRIPLLIGYQINYSKFDLFAKGGIIYSHIFKNKSEDMNEIDKQSHMIKMEYIKKERQSNQLQYVASLGVSYKIYKRLSISGEIMGKYYQNSFYKNEEFNTKPWSYEARIGLIYLLN